MKEVSRFTALGMKKVPREYEGTVPKSLGGNVLV